MGESHDFRGHHEHGKKNISQGKPGEPVHEGKVIEFTGGKGHGGGGGHTYDKYEDVDSFASEFLKKKHEFFLRESLLSMQARAKP